MGVTTDTGIQRILTLIDADITHIGIGTGAAPTEASTTLANEQFRKETTSFTDGNTLIIEAFFDTNEANGNTYTNTGAFCNGATSTLGTGELFAGGGISVPKTSVESITISFEIQVEAVNT